MNINLIYEGKNYNFDIPNGVTIAYLKELSSKIFNSEKKLLDLIYNNEKMSIKDDNTLIRDLIPEGETNTVLTVQINKDSKKKNIKKNKKIIPLVNLRQKKSLITIKEHNENDDKVNNNKDKKEKKDNKDNKEMKDNNIDNKENQDNKIIEKKPIKIFEPINSKEESNNYILKNDNDKIKLNINGVDIINNYNFKGKNINKKITFESIYIKKNNEFLSLIKEFTDKIKKIYFILYNKFKNSNLINNNFSNNISSFSSNNTSRNSINININNNSFFELSLYERKIINFVERQIQYYKSLLETLRKYDNNINFSQLNDFFNKLLIFDENKNTNLDPIKHIKLKNVPSKKLYNSISSINISTSNIIKKLPFLKNNNIISPMINEKSRNLLKNSLNKNSSVINSNHKKLSHSKEIKIRQSNTINNENINIKNKTKISNFKESILSPKNSLNNIEILSDRIENNKIKNINIISPISPHRKEYLNNHKYSFDRFSNINNEKEENNIEEKSNIRTSVKNLNILKNTPEKKIIYDEMRGYDNNDAKKRKKIKDIDVSSMTINDSNFHREKDSPIRKSRKNSKNKYDFII